MYTWKDKWMNGKINCWINGCINRYLEEKVLEGMDGWINRWIVGLIGGWLNGQMDILTDV